MTIPTIQDVFIMLLVGLLAASAIIPAYWFVAVPMNRMIKQLEALPDGLRSDRSD